MSDVRQPRSRKDFQIVVICALRLELDVVEAIFDGNSEELKHNGKTPNDPNAYSLGGVANYDIVLATMLA